jgi:hypothetical protein
VRPIFQIPALILFLLLVMAADVATAQNKRKLPLPGRRAMVVDERFSALRTAPEMKSELKQRLRKGRMVGVLGVRESRSREKFFLLAVSRRTRGWVLSEAVVRSGHPADAERLFGMMEETTDEFSRVRLSRLCADEFRSTAFAPRALLAMAEAAEKASERLTKDCRRAAGDQGHDRRKLFLNHPGLDRYNRLGVIFEYDATADRIVYDGGAYRELVRRYPKSEQAQAAAAKLTAAN